MDHVYCLLTASLAESARLMVQMLQKACTVDPTLFLFWTCLEFLRINLINCTIDMNLFVKYCDSYKKIDDIGLLHVSDSMQKYDSSVHA